MTPARRQPTRLAPSKCALSFRPPQSQSRNCSFVFALTCSRLSLTYLVCLRVVVLFGDSSSSWLVGRRGRQRGDVASDKCCSRTHQMLSTHANVRTHWPVVESVEASEYRVLVVKNKPMQQRSRKGHAVIRRESRRQIRTRTCAAVSVFSPATTKVLDTLRRQGKPRIHFARISYFHICNSSFRVATNNSTCAWEKVLPVETSQPSQRWRLGVRLWKVCPSSPQRLMLSHHPLPLQRQQTTNSSALMRK